MRFPRPDDPELLAAIRRYVVAGPATQLRRYLSLLHGGAMGLTGTDRAKFAHAMGQDAQQVTDRESDDQAGHIANSRRSAR